MKRKRVAKHQNLVNLPQPCFLFCLSASSGLKEAHSPAGMLAIQHFNSSGATVPSNDMAMLHKLEMKGLASPNATAPRSPTSASLNMTLGILFNMVALIILVKAYNRFRRRSKATFLLFASSLVATDLAGHIISGSLVLSRYSASTSSSNNGTFCFQGDPDNPDPSCQFLGGCMVFFGLCPLFLGCAMAAERCLGITMPLLHARLLTTARTKMALAVIWFLALFVALLPVFHLGDYTYQYPWTWCFIRVMHGTKATDLAYMILFSSLALSSLAVAFVCNTISGITLVKARLRTRCPSQRFSVRSHDTEMVVQLVGIMVTSCICWSPLLVSSQKRQCAAQRLVEKVRKFKKQGKKKGFSCYGFTLGHKYRDFIVNKLSINQ